MMGLDGVLIAVAAMFCAAWVLGRWVQADRRAEIIWDCCCDDFVLWDREVDGDYDEPALVVPVPSSDEHLMDLAYTAGVAKAREVQS